MLPMHHHSVQVQIGVERRLLRMLPCYRSSALLSMRTHKNRTPIEGFIFFRSIDFMVAAAGPSDSSDHILIPMHSPTLIIRHRIICRLWNHLTTHNNINADCCQTRYIFEEREYFGPVHMLCFTPISFPISLFLFSLVRDNFSASSLHACVCCVYRLLSQHLYTHTNFGRWLHFYLIS